MEERVLFGHRGGGDVEADGRGVELRGGDYGGVGRGSGRGRQDGGAGVSGG